MFAFDVWTPCTTRFVFEFRYRVAEENGFPAGEDFVTQFVGIESARNEVGDSRGYLRMAG